MLLLYLKLKEKKIYSLNFLYLYVQIHLISIKKSKLHTYFSWHHPSFPWLGLSILGWVHPYIVHTSILGWVRPYLVFRPYIVHLSSILPSLVGFLSILGFSSILDSDHIYLYQFQPIPFNICDLNFNTMI